MVKDYSKRRNYWANSGPWMKSAGSRGLCQHLLHFNLLLCIVWLQPYFLNQRIWTERRKGCRWLLSPANHSPSSHQVWGFLEHRRVFSLALTFYSHLTLVISCLFVDGLILLSGLGTTFLDQSGTDVTSSPLLATFSTPSTSLHTQYLGGGKLHIAKFSYIIYGVYAGP